MPAKQNLLNKVFSRLTVKQELSHRTKNGDVVWLCECVCGKTIEANTRKLNSNHVRSCGCLRNDSDRRTELFFERTKQDPFLTHKVHGVRQNAIRSNKKIDLSAEDICFLVTQKCFYCNSLEIEQGMLRRFKGNKKWIKPTNGIDRIDSEFGYTKDNVRPCCSNCNYMKRTLSEDEFFKHIEKLYNNLIKIGKLDSNG